MLLLCSHHRAKRILDRKSTRLNSIHSQISYAVFCLKKKMRGPALTGAALLWLGLVRGKPPALLHHGALVLQTVVAIGKPAVTFFFFFFRGGPRQIPLLPTANPSPV